MSVETTGASTAPRLTALEVSGFRGWRGEGRLRLDASITLFEGENAAGKSSTLNAIEWCLFGAEVAKKASGIDERGDWDVVARRGAAEARVRLELASPEGTAVLERRRARDAKVRDPDEFTVTLPSGDVLEGEEELASWWTHTGMPDWDEWKHAFCQHQELARVRVLDAGERSLQLGRLLGLEPYQEWTARFKALRPKDLEREAQAALDSVEAAMADASSRPRREAERLAAALESRGVDRLELGPDRVRRALQSLAEAGGALSTSVGLEADAPAPDEVRELQRWARDLPPRLDRARRRIEDRLREDRADCDAIAKARDAREPAERAWRDARDARAAFEREHGSLQRMQDEAQQLDEQLGRLDDDARREDALLALLERAREQHGGAADCPVCEQEAPRLDERLDARITALSSESATRRAEQRAGLEARRGVLRDHLRRARELEQAEAGAEANRERARREWSRVFATGTDDAADAGALLDRRRREVRRGEELLAELDRGLDEFRTATEVTDQLVAWLAEHERAEAARGDLDDLESWRELNAAIDEAAGLARDLEVLERMTRDLQEARSTDRVRAVNASLGEHYATITGADEDARARVRVKATAAKLSYELIDGSGESLLPVLNQAALNALSLAILFAKAEHRATRGRPAWILLDDPGQSLDAAGRRGLATALRALSVRVPVVVATFAGGLADDLRAAPEARTYRLSAATRGVEAEELTR